MSQAMTQAVTRGPAQPLLPSPTMLVFAVMLAVTVGGIAWTAVALSDPAALPIRKVLVEGEFTHLDPAVLQQAVVESVDAGFFGVDVAGIRSRLLDEPWIRGATIRRVWPDALHVSVVEQAPVARWGASAMLNEVGDVFAPAPDDFPHGLVRLDGPLGSEVEVLDRYRYVARQLAQVGIGVTAVTLSARHAWSVDTADGKQLVLGRSALEERLARFLFGYRRGLNEIWQQVGRVDLRYTNGFAVAGANAPVNG